MERILIIRPATKFDLIPLKHLVFALGKELSDKFDYPDMSPLTWEGIKIGIDQMQAVYVAQNEKGLVGFVAWVALPGFPPGIVNGFGTYVMPEYRRTSVSENLRQMARSHCRVLGYKSVLGVTAAGNEAGIRSVEELGFKEVGRLYRLEL